MAEASVQQGLANSKNQGLKVSLVAVELLRKAIIRHFQKAYGYYRKDIIGFSQLISSALLTWQF